MAAYDAEIRVKTKVDNGDVIKLEAVLNEAEKQADDLGDAMKDVQLNRETAEAAQQAATAVNYLERETRKAAAATGELEDAWKNTKIHLSDGSTLDWDGNVIEEAVKDTAALNREQSGLADTAARAAEAMRRMGEETRAENAAAYGTDAAGTEKELTPVQNMLSFIKNSFQDIPLLFGGIADKFTSKARQMQDEWDNLSNRADAYKRILKELESEDKGFGDREYDEAYKEWQKAEQAVREYKKQLLSTKKVQADFLLQPMHLGKSFDGIFRKMTAALKKFFSSTQSGAKKTGGVLGTMASRMKGLALSLLFFNWISKGFNAMVSGMKNGFKALAGYSREYASSVQTLKNALGTLGNSFAAAFAPIVQTVIPYLAELINWVTRAINAVAQLIAYLSGKSTWTKATEVQNGYSDALNGTASAAKKAAGALAKFDDLDVLQKKDTAGGGGGATDGFEEVPIDSEIKSFWDKIKNMWDEADFSDWGKMLADRINEFLEGIDWESIRETARKLGRSLATFLNGIIENLDWKLLGRTIAQGINTAFEFAFGFLRDFNWAAFGQGLANLINGAMQGLDWLLIYNTIIMGAYGIAKAINNFVATLNWAELGRTLANGINVAVDGLIAFLTAVDWQKMGTKIGLFLRKAIETIEWKDIGRALGMIIQKAVDFVGSILDEMNWDDVKQAIKDLFEGFGEETEDVPGWIKTLAASLITLRVAIAGLDAVLAGVQIARNIKKIAEVFVLIKEKIWGFILFFKGINWQSIFAGMNPAMLSQLAVNITDLIKDTWLDPSSWDNPIGALIRYLGEVHERLWDAVYDFLDDFWGNLKRAVTTIFDLSWVKELFDKALQNFSNAFSGKDIGWNLVKGLFNGISAALGFFLAPIVNLLDTIIEGVCELFGIHSPSTVFYDIGYYLIEGLLLGIQETWQVIVEFFQITLDSIILFFVEKWEFLKETTSEIWNSIALFFSETWTGIQETASEIWEPIKEFIIETWTVIKDKAIEIWEIVKVTFTEKFDAIKTKVEEIMTKFDEFKLKVKKIFENVKEKIISTLDPVINKIQGFIDKIKEAIQAMKDWAAEKIEGIGNFIGGVLGGNKSSRAAMPSAASYSLNNLNEMSSIPHLATGAVIRGGNPFMAVLGDQPSGQTNIEAPLSTIREAVREELSGLNFGNGGQTKVVLRLNGQDVGEAIVEDLLSVMNRKGYDVEVLGVT